MPSLRLTTATAIVLAPMSAEFQVNTYTTLNQRNPTVAHLDDGTFAVYFSSNQPGASVPGLTGIFGRVYSSDGIPVAESETMLDTSDTYSNIEPHVARNAPGTFVVVWRQYDTETPNDSLFVRRAGVDQIGIGGAINFADGLAASDFFPDVAGVPAGGFVVVWSRNDPTIHPDATRVFWRRFDSTAVPVTPEVAVAPTAENAPTNAAVTVLPDGSSEVAWMELSPDGFGDGILLRRVASDGAPVGDATVVNSYTTRNQQYPGIASLADGRFIVTWESYGQDSDSEGVFAQRYAESGDRVGTEFQVNTYTTGAQRRPKVVVNDDSTFTVLWLSEGQDGSDFGLFARPYDWDAGPLSSEFQVNTYTTGEQGPGFAASTAGDGTMVVTWTGARDQDGDRDGVFARRLCLADTADIRCGVIDSTVAHTVVPVPELSTATSALVALRAAVGIAACPLCSCDADGSGAITVTDALRFLREAVGLPEKLSCPPCCIASRARR
jgi:hypothetical protein